MQDKRRAAIDWLIRLQETPEDAGLRAGLEAWLAQDASHAALWHDLNQLDGAIGAAERNRKTRRRTAGIAALALLALGLGWLAWPAAAPNLLADHASGTGETKTVTLADGSQVTLAPMSAIAIDSNPAARRVRLLRGQAWFEVQHDPAHPFHVKAGETETTVLGTAFAVDLKDDGAEVAVARGSVRVAHKQAKLSERLLAGEAVTVSATGGRRETVNPASVAAWRQGQLILRERPLGEVIAAMRPWLPGFVLTRGDGFARHVTGVYDMNDPEAALLVLARAHRLQIARVSPWLTIVSAR